MNTPANKGNTSRRKFVKASALSMLLISVLNRVLGRDAEDNMGLQKIQLFRL